jgi:EAL domain-containing protein (putative c-di-GMP-specific phosphodiesterase class I)
MLDDIAGDLPRLCERFGSQISVSQNLSALQVGDVEFMDYYTASAARHGVQRQLVVEMTEDALVAAHNFQHKVLPQLRELGLRVSIDDFGTGYSSLSVLSDITADEIKIDRAFITEIHKRPRSQGILRAVESLCNAFQIGMVAEGPETKEEIEYLCKNTSIGCGQGYFFSKPRFVEELETVQYAI